MKYFKMLLIGLLVVTLIPGTLMIFTAYRYRNDGIVADFLSSHDKFECDELNLIVYWEFTEEKKEFIETHNLNIDEIWSPGYMVVNKKEYIIDFVMGVDYDFLIRDLSNVNVDGEPKILVSGYVDTDIVGDNIYLCDITTDLKLPNESTKFKIVGK